MNREALIPFFRSVFMIFAGIAVFLFLLTGIDSLLDLSGPVMMSSLLLPDSMDFAYRSLNNIARSTAQLLTMLVSGLAIALPLAANNYTPRLIRMFTRDRTNRTMFGLLLAACAASIWSVWTMREGFYPRVTLSVSFVLYFLALSAIVPYLFYLFRFLNPDTILFRLRTGAAHLIDLACGDKLTTSKIDELRRQVIEGIDSIGNIALRALERRDRQAFNSALDNLEKLATHHAEVKSRLVPRWYELEAGLFSGMPQAARDDIRDRKIVFSFYLSQVLLGLFESLGSRMRDASDPLGFTCYRIASYYLAARDEAAMRVYCSLFNSVLRLALNTSDIRLIFNVMHHYSRLAVDSLDHDTAVMGRISEYIASYTRMAAEKGAAMEFMVELAAHEFAYLYQAARKKGHRSHQEALVDIICSLPLRGTRGKPLYGVMKARLITAAMLGPEAQAEGSSRLLEPLRALSADEIKEIRRDLVEENPVLYWEITARQMNLDYVPKDKRSAIEAAISSLREG